MPRIFAMADPLRFTQTVCIPAAVAMAEFWKPFTGYPNTYPEGHALLYVKSFRGFINDIYRYLGVSNLGNSKRVLGSGPGTRGRAEDPIVGIRNALAGKLERIGAIQR
jgi:hypothetical protein